MFCNCRAAISYLALTTSKLTSPSRSFKSTGIFEEYKNEYPSFIFDQSLWAMGNGIGPLKLPVGIFTPN